MILVGKPTTVPAVLLSRGTADTQTHCTEHDAAPADYRTGAKTFDFDKSIYAHPQVKSALIESQKKKCAFCESLIRHVTYGAIEHFRPKAGYKQRKGDTLKRPGYYWLAYTWDNLLFCCQLCNEQFKQNHFPLRVGRLRARTPTDRLDGEEPLLINPALTDPRAHITFRQERAVVVGDSLAGKTTIRLLGLNRSELKEARSRRLDSLRNLLRARTLLRDRIALTGAPAFATKLANVNRALQQATAAEAEYAPMARAFLASAP
ncbi:MAG TPA: hypothetical protein VGE74_24280 [Gemmata sp.]